MADSRVPGRARRSQHSGPTSDVTVAEQIERLSRVIVPRSDLVYDDAFQLLVAVVLSAQTTDAAVNLVTPALFAAAPDAARLAGLGAEGILPLIRRVGLAPTKAKNLAGLARQLVERHGGVVPGDRAALEDLPGVGRKTASVVLNIAFGQPTIAVDTHVHRVANRLGIAATQRVEDTEQVLEQRIPARHRLHAHHYLILHGRYTCTARAPRCADCVLRDVCPARVPSELMP